MLTRTVPCASWAAFKANLYPVLYGERFEEGKYVFRGMGDAAWRLESSFDRYAAAIPPVDRAAEAQRLLDLFVEECASDTVIEPCPEDPEERLAIAQHYDLPTRALDWTDSPYVASHFAFADVQPRGGPGEAVVWALATEHSAWDGGGVKILRVSGRGNDRILRQRGAFTHLEAPYATLEEYVETCEDEGDPALCRFLLPRSEAATALADLRAMGISSTRLFPDRTGAARAALARCFG